jgi:hypothetical protein
VRTGRPVLFIGPERADTAIEIRKHGWGETLPAGSSGEAVAEAIERLGNAPTKDWKPGNGAKKFADFVGALD